jgi:hypothetical protein
VDRDTGATDLGEALALLADNDHPVAKTGTLGPLRHEPPVAVAVSPPPPGRDRHLPRVDAAIGTTARTAVTSLRATAPR